MQTVIIDIGPKLQTLISILVGATFLYLIIFKGSEK